MDSRVGTTFGKYNITRLLGKGGGGVVYEAYDTGKGRTVALKILAEEFSNDVTFRTRFQRESQAAAILQEPHASRSTTGARLTAVSTSTCAWCRGRRFLS